MTRVRVVAASAHIKAGLENLLAPAFATVDEEPDVLVVDSADWDEETAAEWAAQLVPVVALVGDAGDTAVLLRAGIRALLPHQAEGRELAAAVDAAAAGLIAVHPGFIGAVAAPARAREANSVSLTPREIEVLRLLADGEANKQIAYLLGITEHTVKFHVASILQKLDAGTRTEAVAIGIRRGLVMV